MISKVTECTFILSRLLGIIFILSWLLVSSLCWAWRVSAHPGTSSLPNNAHSAMFQLATPGMPSRLNPGHQPLQQVPLPSEPLHQSFSLTSTCFLLFFVLRGRTGAYIQVSLKILSPWSLKSSLCFLRSVLIAFTQAMSSYSSWATHTLKSFCCGKAQMGKWGKRSSPGKASLNANHWNPFCANPSTEV